MREGKRPYGPMLFYSEQAEQPGREPMNERRGGQRDADPQQSRACPSPHEHDDARSERPGEKHEVQDSVVDRKQRLRENHPATEADVSRKGFHQSTAFAWAGRRARPPAICCRIALSPVVTNRLFDREVDQNRQ